MQANDVEDIDVLEVKKTIPFTKKYLKEHATIMLKMRSNSPNSHIAFKIEYCNIWTFCLIL